MGYPQLWKPSSSRGLEHWRNSVPGPCALWQLGRYSPVVWKKGAGHERNGLSHHVVRRIYTCILYVISRYNINIYNIYLQYILCKLLDISIHNFVLRQCSIFLISELQKMIYLRPSMHVNATYPKMLHRSSPLDGGNIAANRRITHS